MDRNTLILLINILCGFTGTIRAFRVLEVGGMTKVLAVENENVSIVCRTGEPMAYCGFVHPSGKRLSFSGETLRDGKCAVQVQVTQFDTGMWRCHIGKSTVGEEIEQLIEVRISGEVSAIQRNITVTRGKDVTLTCVTTKEKMPLRYCRFEPPDGVPFSIDSHVRLSRPILNRYYFPQNMSLDRGDCAVTIHNVKYKDTGVWTCGVGMDDDGQEHTDFIRLEVEGLYTLTAASSNGIVLACLAIAAILIILGVVAWKRRGFLGVGAREPQVMEIQALGPRQPSPGGRSRSPRSVRSMTPSRMTRSSRSLTPSRTIPTVVVQSPSENSKEGSIPL